jgi:hypothetical protein
MLYVDEPRLRPTPAGALYLDGPRVNLSFMAGRMYHRAVYESLGDREALAEARTFEADGLDWGRFQVARSERDGELKPWFFPPRPIREDHLEFLRLELARAIEAGRGGQGDGRVVEPLARFHQAFVRLHPFYCANQSLAMNLVNFVLGTSHCGAIPHLILDHMALRLSSAAYEELLRRAVRTWAVPESDPIRRLDLLRERWRKAASLIQRAANCRSARELEALSAADPEAARWSLIGS